MEKSIQKFKSGVKNFGLMATCLFTTVTAIAQDKTYPIKTTAKPDDLKTYEVSEANGNINLLFTKKGKKNEVYTNYVFDKDLNLVTETEEELSIEQVKSKSSFWSGWSKYINKSGIIRDSVLSVENNMLGLLTLKTGYIGWHTWSYANPAGGTTTVSGVGFVEREKVKVKDDATGRRLQMVAYQTDAPAEFFATGKSVSSTIGMSTGGTIAGKTRGGFDNDKRVSSITGDVMVVSCINTLGLKDKTTGEMIKGANIWYVAQRFSAKTLQKITDTKFEFQYSTKMLYNQEATDDSHDILLIFAPTHGGVKPYFAPNKSEYEYIRIGVDTKIKERVKFISPYGRLNSLQIYNFDDETVIFGTSKAGREDKYADFVAFKGGDDHLVTIRIKNGQEPVIKATPMKNLGIEIQRFASKDVVKTTDNQLWITGQANNQKDAEKDPEKWGDIYAFNIAADGSVVKNLVLPQVEKKSEQAAAPVSLIQLNDGSLLWNTYEYTKKGNMYPKYAKINNGNLGAIVFPGDKKYVVNDMFPFYLSSDVKYLLYFGNTEDNKQFWLHKEAL